MASALGPNTLGGLIRREREKQGLSIRQLARLVEVDPAAVLRWERDGYVPKAIAIAALARVLDVPTADLMALSGVEYPHDAPSLPAMLRAEYDLPPEAIEQVQRYVDRLARKHAPRPTADKNSKKNEGRNS